MKVALIPPTQRGEWAEMGEERQKAFLLLPQLFVYPQYADWARGLRLRYPEALIIMDNGAAEGERVKSSRLIELAVDCNVTELVMPDTLMDLEDTMDRVNRFVRLWRSYEFEPWVRQPKLAGVLQGNNMSQFIKCAMFYDTIPEVDIVHAPRLMNNVMGARGRLSFVENLFSYLTPHYTQVHCLGSALWCREAAALQAVPQVRSMDTSLPIYLGLLGYDISKVPNDIWIPRPEGYFEMNETTHTRLVEHNIMTFLGWAS